MTVGCEETGMSDGGNGEREVVKEEWNDNNVTFSLSPDRTDDGHGLPGAPAAGVPPHAAGVALRLRRLPGAVRLRHRATVVVDEVCVCVEGGGSCL